MNDLIARRKVLGCLMASAIAPLVSACGGGSSGSSGAVDAAEVNAQKSSTTSTTAFAVTSPAQNAAAFIAPVLLFHGDIDQNVGVGESRLMASRLKSAGKSVELVEYHRLAHQLDDSNVRAEMLDKMDAFLRASLHLPVAP